MYCLFLLIWNILALKNYAHPLIRIACNSLNIPKEVA